MNCFEDPGCDAPLDGNCYLIYGKLRKDAIEMYIASVTKGDDQYDELVKKLGLQTFSCTEDNYETAEEWARKDARTLHPTLPIEIRFFQDGDLAEPAGMYLIPASDDQPRKCENCRSDGKNLKEWRSFYKWGHPYFCSGNCVSNWYENVPFENQKTGAAESAQGV